MLHNFADIHTHKKGKPGSILSIAAKEAEGIAVSNKTLPAAERQHYSLQLHPWHLKDRADIEEFTTTAARLAHDPEFAAIGECGLDSLCQTPIALQREAFVTALQTARSLGKPTIVHCVKRWAEMLEDVNTVFPELRKDPGAYRQYQVVVHGFRRGTQLAQQLLDAGLAISLGTKYNPDVAKMVPPERRFAETDEE